MSYDEKKPSYRFAGNDGSKPILVQDGRVYDVKGTSLDSEFASDNTAENLIQWLWAKNYCITPEARHLIIKEKQRVALERQTAELVRRNERLVEEELARMEAQLAESEKVLRDQADLHLKPAPVARTPLRLTPAEEEILGSGRTTAIVPEPPEVEELIPKELEEMKAVVQTKSKKAKV